MWNHLLQTSSLPLIGTKKISFFWGFAVPLDHKLWCHHLFYQVIVCTLDFLLLLLMLRQLIAVLLSSITQGTNNHQIFSTLVLVPFLLTYSLFPGLVHLNLSYPFQSTLKLYFTPVFQLGCDFGCFLRLKSQVSEGKMLYSFLQFVVTNHFLQSLTHLIYLWLYATIVCGCSCGFKVLM